MFAIQNIHDDERNYIVGQKKGSWVQNLQRNRALKSRKCAQNHKSGLKQKKLLSETTKVVLPNHKSSSGNHFLVVENQQF